MTERGMRRQRSTSPFGFLPMIISLLYCSSSILPRTIVADAWSATPSSLALTSPRTRSSRLFQEYNNNGYADFGPDSENPNGGYYAGNDGERASYNNHGNPSGPEQFYNSYTISEERRGEPQSQDYGQRRRRQQQSRNNGRTKNKNISGLTSYSSPRSGRRNGRQQNIRKDPFGMSFSITNSRPPFRRRVRHKRPPPPPRRYPPGMMMDRMMMMRPFFEDPFMGMDRFFAEESRMMDRMMRQQEQELYRMQQRRQSMIRDMQFMKNMGPQENNLQPILEQASSLLREELGEGITVGPIRSQSSSSSYVSSMDPQGRPIKEARSILQLNVEIYQSPPPWNGVKLQVENNRLQRMFLQSGTGQTREIQVASEGPATSNPGPFSSGGPGAIIDAEIVPPEESTESPWNALEGDMSSSEEANGDPSTWAGESWNYDYNEDASSWNEYTEGETWNGYNEGEYTNESWMSQQDGGEEPSWNENTFNSEEESSSSSWSPTNEVY